MGANGFAVRTRKTKQSLYTEYFTNQQKIQQEEQEKKQKILAGIRQIVFWLSLVSMFETLKYVELLCFELFYFKLLQNYALDQKIFWKRNY